VLLAERLLQVCSIRRWFLNIYILTSTDWSSWWIWRRNGAILLQCPSMWNVLRWGAIYVCKSIGFFPVRPFWESRMVFLRMLPT
jgi:hypothetical protein